MQGLFGAGFHGEGESGNLITIKSRSSSNHDQNQNPRQSSISMMQWPKSAFSKAQVCDHTDYIGTTFQFRPGTVEVVKVGVNKVNKVIKLVKVKVKIKVVKVKVKVEVVKVGVKVNEILLRCQLHSTTSIWEWNYWLVRQQAVQLGGRWSTICSNNSGWHLLPISDHLKRFTTAPTFRIQTDAGNLMLLEQTQVCKPQEKTHLTYRCLCLCLWLCLVEIRIRQNTVYQMQWCSI